MAVDVQSGLREEVEEFLYREAWLLDHYKFHEWLELLTEDVHYWMPTLESRYGSPDRYQEDELHLAYIDDDRHLIEMRVKQLDTGLRRCETPPSVTQRLISNVLVSPVPELINDPDEIIAHSNFQVTQIRHGTHENHYTGAREDRLRRVDGRWKIAERKVVLAQAVLPRTLAIFL